MWQESRHVPSEVGGKHSLMEPWEESLGVAECRAGHVGCAADLTASQAQEEQATAWEVLR